MDSKWSLSPPKPERRTRKKKNSRQSSQQCITEPTQPHKDTLRSTEQTLSNSESPSVGGTQQDELLTKEASAVDYLRDLSEDESHHFMINSNVAQLEEEQSPENTSDRLSPFNNPKKKKKATSVEKTHKEKKSMVISSTNMNIQSKVARDIYRSKEEYSGDAKKRVRSEPNETIRTLKAMQGKSYQFVYPKFLQKGVSSKITFGTNFNEEENNYQYELKVEERMTQKDFRSADNQGLHHVHNRVSSKDEESGPKLPSVLQIKKLVGCSYSQLLQSMEPQGIKTERPITSQENEEGNHVITNRLPIRKALCPGEKKVSENRQLNLGDEMAVLVGRSLSVPKVSQGIEKMLEKNAESRKTNLKGNKEKKGIERGSDGMQRYREENVYRRLSSPDSKATSQYNTLIESMERIYSENKRSEITNTPREEEGNSTKYHKSKAKSELPIHLLNEKKAGFGDLNFRDQKIIEDMKANFVFKSKKAMIDIVSPEEEVHISQEERLIQRSASRAGTRESSRENKLSNEKNSKMPKLKLLHLANKKPKEPISTFLLPEIQETLRAKLRSKDAISNLRDNKLSNPLSRKNSGRDVGVSNDSTLIFLFNELLEVDGPVFSIKVPKFKAILKAVGKNIESERFSPLLRPTEREMMSERPAQVQMLTKKAL